MSSDGFYYHIFAVASVYVLKIFNEIVTEPYMDEPFHVPQAQAYCRGEWNTWDPKLTTPPGMYLVSVLMRKLFLFKCNLPVLRLTPMLALVALPIAVSRVIAFHQREPPPPLLLPMADAVVLAAFPIAWFFGFLYYTEVPSLLLVTSTVGAAMQGRHRLAALLGAMSCTFRQTNVIWVLYAYAASQLMYLRFRRPTPGGSPQKKLHDSPALEAGPGDLIPLLASVPNILPDILGAFVPYALVLAGFAAFVVWNGGIVLGDKSNHIPTLHVPQLYYFVAFAAMMGWPVLVAGPGGLPGLLADVRRRMIGSSGRTLVTIGLSAVMAVTVRLFTIHHPFLLSDNRHYTFYVWRRVYMLHPAVPYLLVPGYIACAWAWFLRVGREQTLLQTLVLPVCLLPTLLPTPLLEPRYFLVPYILMRAQITDVKGWNLALEGAWYMAINAVTMYVFLYHERAGVGRFMW